MTSSTKLEVHNVLHCHQRKTEPPMATRNIEKISSSSEMWFMRHMSKQTDIQTPTSILCTLPRGKLIKIYSKK